MNVVAIESEQGFIHHQEFRQAGHERGVLHTKNSSTVRKKKYALTM
jgi:hypothetical protein